MTVDITMPDKFEKWWQHINTPILGYRPYRTEKDAAMLGFCASQDIIDALARTLESIHGDCEMMLKRIHDEKTSKKQCAKFLQDIFGKCKSVRHITKAII